MKWDSSRRSSTAGRRNSSRTGLLPSSRNGQPTIPLTRSGLHTCRKDPDEGRGSGRAHGGARRAKKRHWGTLTGSWVPHHTRDQIVDFIRRWSEKIEISAGRLIGWLDIAASKFYDWRQRDGR